MKPKYVRVASDLHLEQYDGRRLDWLDSHFMPPDPRDAESVLVLAGDISSNPYQAAGFMHLMMARFMHVYYVPGNHEFYGHDIAMWEVEFLEHMYEAKPGRKDWEKIAIPRRDDIRDYNFDYAHLDVCHDTLENVRIIFGTLWADGGDSIEERAKVGKGLRDFYVIRKHKTQRFTVPDMCEINARQQKQIRDLLQQKVEVPTLVVTHHLPSYTLCHPRFGNEINGGFASHCDDIIRDLKPEWWVHGHTHDTIRRKLFSTEIICNPSGYYFENDGQYKQYVPTFINLETQDDNANQRRDQGQV